MFEIELNQLEEKGLYRSLRQVEGSQGRTILIDGRKVLNFCSNNYLGLADDEQLKTAAMQSINEEGLGSGASRLIVGNMASHHRLEKRIAEFKGCEAALMFSSGYMANSGIISSLFGRGDIIFSDRFNHASIVDGILLSRAEFKRYPHCDMDALENLLKANQNFRRKCIVTDTVFSMDGDMAPLDKITALAKQYNCRVMVDEAHAFGVLGSKGKGAVEYFGLENEVDIQMGTLSKAAGSYGAYVCGSKKLIDYLINHARSFIYTTGLPPSIAAASLKAIDIIEHDSQRRERLWDNTKFLLTELKQLKFDTRHSPTPIIPIIVKDTGLAVQFSQRLFEEGIMVSAIRSPTVPANTARLRITVMATHTKEDLECLVKKLGDIGKEMGII